MKLFYGIILVLIVFVSACSQQAAQPAAQPAPQPSPEPIAVPEEELEIEEPEVEVSPPETDSVEIRYVGAGGFDPDILIITAGSAVTWINGDEKPGAVIIFKDGRSFLNSQRILPDGKFEQEFTDAGEYEYWWNIAYGTVSGMITVE